MNQAIMGISGILIHEQLADKLKYTGNIFAMTPMFRIKIAAVAPVGARAAGHAALVALVGVGSVQRYQI